MKLRADQVDRLVAKPPGDLAAALIYGPDVGLARERADRLLEAVAGPRPDPFGHVELTDADLRQDMARLADEAASLSLGGGRRTVVVRGAWDALAQVLKPILSGDRPPAAFLILVAGDLGPRSALRQLFEQAPNAAALPCYLDEGRALEQLVREELGARDVRVEPEALRLIQESLGADRMASRSELRKLALYAGDGGSLSYAEVATLLGDSASRSLDDVALAATGADRAGLERALTAAFAEGHLPVQILRFVGRHLLRLAQLGDKLAAGEEPRRAMASMRPPVFFKHQSVYEAQARVWGRTALRGATERLVEAENRCKSTGMPDRLLCHRTLIELGQGARRGR